MRILCVIPTLSARDGGPAQVVLQMCRELVRRGHRTSIYTTDADRLPVPYGEPVLNQDGVEVTYFPLERPRGFRLSRPMVRALTTGIPDYDLIHIHSLYQFPSTVAAHYCRQYGKPYLLRPHGTLDPFIRGRHRARKAVYEWLFERRNLARAAAVHFTSSEEMKLARSLGFAFRGVVAPPGVEVEGLADADPSVLERRWPELRGKKVVLHFGRLNFKKGLDLLADAFARVARERDDVRLVIAGPDDEGYGSRVREWLRAGGVLDRATFTGMLLGAEKAAALKRADLFALPSYSENFGVAVVEAMSARVPVVVSNKVNIWREIAEAGAGTVVNCNADELARAIASILDDRALGRRMGEQGERLAREQFSWNVTIGRILETYENVIAGTESPGIATGAVATR